MGVHLPLGYPTNYNWPLLKRCARSVRAGRASYDGNDGLGLLLGDPVPPASAQRHGDVVGDLPVHSSITSLNRSTKSRRLSEPRTVTAIEQTLSGATLRRLDSCFPHSPAVRRELRSSAIVGEASQTPRPPRRAGSRQNRCRSSASVFLARALAPLACRPVPGGHPGARARGRRRARRGPRECTRHRSRDRRGNRDRPGRPAGPAARRVIRGGVATIATPPPARTEGREIVVATNERISSGELAEITSGPSGSHLEKLGDVPGGVPVVTPSAITDQHRVDTRKLRTLPYEQATRLDRFTLRQDDIVLVRQGTLGKLALDRPRQTGHSTTRRARGCAVVTAECCPSTCGCTSPRPPRKRR